MSSDSPHTVSKAAGSSSAPAATATLNELDSRPRLGEHHAPRWPWLLAVVLFAGALLYVLA